MSSFLPIIPKSLKIAVFNPNSSGRPIGTVSSIVPMAKNSAPRGLSVINSFGPTPALSKPLNVVPPLKKRSLILNFLLE